MERLAAFGMALLLACSSSTAPASGGGGGEDDDYGGIQRAGGQWCADTLVDVVVRGGQGAEVTVHLNVTEFRDVAGNDGILRRQEVRSCLTVHCTFGNTDPFTDAELIASCAEQGRQT